MFEDLRLASEQIQLAQLSKPLHRARIGHRDRCALQYWRIVYSLLVKRRESFVMVGSVHAVDACRCLEHTASTRMTVYISR